MSGVEIIVTLFLKKTWALDEQQFNFDDIIEFFSLRMMPGKAINNYTHRAELVYKRCRTNCGFDLSASGLA